MNGHDIARMLNQIAAFNAAYPHDEAVKGTAQHVRDFWDPRMRAKLAELMAAGGEGLSPLAREAAVALTETAAA